MSARADVLGLGAGMVGVSVALHLQRRGRDVVLIDRWSLGTAAGGIAARAAVVSLGPWSDDVFRPLGYDIRLAVKRDYHMHYRAAGNTALGRPVRDADGGFSLAPMRRGIRLTTGVEFADRDAPPSQVQLARDEPLARELFPLAERLEPEPWMGRRPCLPDMAPAIGRGARHQSRDGRFCREPRTSIPDNQVRYV